MPTPPVVDPHPKDPLADAGVLIVGHGTRDAVGRDEAMRLAQLVKGRIPCPVALAFLELAEPTINASVRDLVAQGIQRLVVAPLLLFAAGHAQDDVPAAVRAALAACRAADLPVAQASHFGCHELLVELSSRRLRAAIDNSSKIVAVNDTLLVLVGRGSREPSATREMHRFATLLSQRTGMPHVRVGFLAMAQPAIEDVLAGIGPSAPQRVIVQPHLLFHGELVERLERLVRKHSAARPEQEWLVSGWLAEDLVSGGDARELLPENVVDLVRGVYRALS